MISVLIAATVTLVVIVTTVTLGYAGPKEKRGRRQTDKDGPIKSSSLTLERE
jgi:hypothetical protein